MRRARRPIPEPAQPGQESVWDYPRPPRLEPAYRRVRVGLDGEIIADSIRCLRVLETSHPPTYYVHPDDLVGRFLVPAEGSSWCEWKGAASYWTVVVGASRVESGAWSYEQPSPAFADLAGFVAFYPALFDCFLDDEKVRPQPGGFYGGWVTSELAGPFKGEPGTLHW